MAHTSGRTTRSVQIERGAIGGGSGPSSIRRFGLGGGARGAASVSPTPRAPVVTAWKRIGTSSSGTPIFERMVDGNTERLAVASVPSASRSGIRVESAGVSQVRSVTVAPSIRADRAPPDVVAPKPVRVEEVATESISQSVLNPRRELSLADRLVNVGVPVRAARPARDDSLPRVREFAGRTASNIRSELRTQRGLTPDARRQRQIARQEEAITGFGVGATGIFTDVVGRGSAAIDARLEPSLGFQVEAQREQVLEQQRVARERTTVQTARVSQLRDVATNPFTVGTRQNPGGVFSPALAARTFETLQDEKRTLATLRGEETEVERRLQAGREFRGDQTRSFDFSTIQSVVAGRGQLVSALGEPATREIPKTIARGAVGFVRALPSAPESTEEFARDLLGGAESIGRDPAGSLAAVPREPIGLGIPLSGIEGAAFTGLSAAALIGGFKIGRVRARSTRALRVPEVTQTPDIFQVGPRLRRPRSITTTSPGVRIGRGSVDVSVAEVIGPVRSPRRVSTTLSVGPPGFEVTRATGPAVVDARIGIAPVPSPKRGPVENLLFTEPQRFGIVTDVVAAIETETRVQAKAPRSVFEVIEVRGAGVDLLQSEFGGRINIMRRAAVQRLPVKTGRVGDVSQQTFGRITKEIQQRGVDLRSRVETTFDSPFITERTPGGVRVTTIPFSQPVARPIGLSTGRVRQRRVRDTNIELIESRISGEVGVFDAGVVDLFREVRGTVRGVDRPTFLQGPQPRPAARPERLTDLLGTPDLFRGLVLESRQAQATADIASSISAGSVIRSRSRTVTQRVKPTQVTEFTQSIGGGANLASISAAVLGRRPTLAAVDVPVQVPTRAVSQEVFGRTRLPSAVATTTSIAQGISSDVGTGLRISPVSRSRLDVRPSQASSVGIGERFRQTLGPETRLRTGLGLGVRPDVAVIARQRVAQDVALDTALVQRQRLALRTVQGLDTGLFNPRPIRRPRPGRRVRVPIPFPTFGRPIRERRAGFVAQVRRRGVFRPVSTRPLTRGAATALGADTVDRTLAASFRIVATGTRARAPRRRLRQPRIIQFRPAVREPGVTVERRRFRLSRAQEVTEIQLARNLERSLGGGL